MISFVAIALDCLELIKLQLERFCIYYGKIYYSISFKNDGYFKGTVISASIMPALLVLFINFDLDLNDSESIELLCGQLLKDWYQHSDFFE